MESPPRQNANLIKPLKRSQTIGDKYMLRKGNSIERSNSIIKLGRSRTTNDNKRVPESHLLRATSVGQEIVPELITSNKSERSSLAIDKARLTKMHSVQTANTSSKLAIFYNSADKLRVMSSKLRILKDTKSRPENPKIFTDVRLKNNL